MIIISKEQVKLLHTQLIKETGGSDGIRDESLLESALNEPFQSFSGTETFPSIQQKAARLGFAWLKIMPLWTVINESALTSCFYS